MGVVESLTWLALVACSIMQSKMMRLLTDRVAACEKLIAQQHAALLCHRDALNALNTTKKRPASFSMN